MAIKLSNNAVSKLAAAILTTDVSLSVLAGDGNLFPALAAGDTFPSTLIDGSGNIEIITVTAKSVDTFTITRAQEGTPARAFNAGDRIELRLTAATFMQTQTTAQNALDTTVTQGTHLTTIDGEITTINAEIAALQAAALPPGFGPVPWSRPSLPAGWIWADGSVLLSNTPYTALRSAYISDNFPFGQDGSGNPKIPDMRGRVAAGQDNMNGTAAGRLTSAGSGIAGTTLGAAGGLETETLTTAQMPAHTHANTLSDPGHSHGVNGGIYGSNGLYYNYYGGGSQGGAGAAIGINAAGSGISISNASQGGGAAHPNVQPTLVTGYIVKT